MMPLPQMHHLHHHHLPLQQQQEAQRPTHSQQQHQWSRIHQLRQWHQHMLMVPAAQQKSCKLLRFCLWLMVCFVGMRRSGAKGVLQVDC